MMDWINMTEAGYGSLVSVESLESKHLQPVRMSLARE